MLVLTPLLAWMEDSRRAQSLEARVKNNRTSLFNLIKRQAPTRTTVTLRNEWTLRFHKKKSATIGWSTLLLGPRVKSKIINKRNQLQRNTPNRPYPTLSPGRKRPIPSKKSFRPK